jgi:hypothetical protein
MKKLRIILLIGLIVFMTPYLISVDFNNLTWDNNAYGYRKIIMIFILIICVIGSMIHDKKKFKMEEDINEKI